MQGYDFSIHGVTRLHGVQDTWQVQLFCEELDREFGVQAATLTMFVGEARARGFMQAQLAGLTITMTVPDKDGA